MQNSYKQLLETLGYNVTDPAEMQKNPGNGYIAMAQGEMDYWPNSWYPVHLGWHDHRLPDGSVIGDHVTIVGEQMIAGGLQGFLVTKSFADEFGVYTMDQLNNNEAALAAFDATDSNPGNGVADIFGCLEDWTCDNIIENQIAFSGWNNISQIKSDYVSMYQAAVNDASDGIPMVLFTWTPSRYITRLRPGDNVYWMGVDEILDGSNPANQEYGEEHSQRGQDGEGGLAPVSALHCPSARDEPSGLCKIGWIASDILVTANNEFLAQNPAARALLEAVKLTVLEVSIAATAQHDEGTSPVYLASDWIANNRAKVSRWLATALSAS